MSVSVERTESKAIPQVEWPRGPLATDDHAPWRWCDSGTTALTIAVAAAAAVALAVATRWGIGLTPDSIHYINGARNLLAGDGLRGMTHFPPLYSAAIAALSLGGADPAETARWLQVLLFPANILLVAWLAYRMTDGTRWCAWLAALLMAVTPVSVGIHSLALSEPMFLALALTCLIAFGAYAQRGGTPMLLLASAAGAAACLTRYPGIALLPALLVGLLWLGRGGWQRRLRDVGVLALVVGVPLGAWMLRNQWLGSNLANRTLAFHPVGAAHVESALVTVSLWLFPRDVPATLRCLLLGLLIGVGAEAARRRFQLSAASDSLRRRLRAAPLATMLLLFAVAYVGLLVVSISFVDFYTPLDSRILSPLYPIGLVFTLAGVRRLLAMMPDAVSFRRAVMTCALLLCALQMVRGADLLVTSYRDGLGFARRSWQQSKLLARVRALPPDTVIYSNAADVIAMLTGRRALGLPAAHDPTSGNANPSFVQERQQMREHLRASRGVLVYFRRVNRPYHPSENYLRQKLYLKTVRASTEGAIYKAGPRPPR